MSKRCYECYWESENEEICERCGQPIREVRAEKDETESNQKPELK
ncbi:MAG TPA: hypothetical protein PL004_05300 [Bacillota bacterium]|nr:hypothetical protein [Bacillota bacterium]